MGSQPLQTCFVIAPIKGLPRKPARGPGVERICSKPGGAPHIPSTPPQCCQDPRPLLMAPWIQVSS